MPAQPAHKIQIQQWWDELERLARILGQVGPDEVCCDGLSQRQCSTLRTLVAQEGARISDLAASSGITPSAMTRVLEKLEARKLVERVRGAQADGRAATVKITAAGRKVREQLDELMRERTRTIVATITVPNAKRARIAPPARRPAARRTCCRPGRSAASIKGRRRVSTPAVMPSRAPAIGSPYVW